MKDIINGITIRGAILIILMKYTSEFSEYNPDRKRHIENPDSKKNLLTSFFLKTMVLLWIALMITIKQKANNIFEDQSNFNSG